MWLQTLGSPHFCIGLFTLVFVFIWMVAWTLNAVENTRFDLTSLRDMYIWLMTQLNATHAINSIWNSPKDIVPLSPPTIPAKKESSG